MKISKAILLGAFLCLNLIPSFSQNEKVAIKKFGLGLHIEQFKSVDIEDLNGAPANKIEFVFSPKSSIRIEPEFGFKTGKVESQDYNSFYTGLGILGMAQRNNLNFYSGLRLEFATIRTEIKNSQTSVKRTSNRIILGPVVGCEYFFAENFSFGGELGLKYVDLSSKREPSSNDYELNRDATYFTTDTGLFIRFYF